MTAQLFAGETGQFLISSDGTAYTAVANVITVELPESDREEYATDPLGATVKTTRPSQKTDYGTTTVTGWYDAADTQHALLVTASRNHTVYNWKVTVKSEDGLKTATTIGSGWVKTFKPGTVQDGNQEFSATIRNTSAWTTSVA